MSEMGVEQKVVKREDVGGSRIDIVKNKNLRFDNHNRSTRRDGDRRTEKRGHACRTTVTRAFYVATSFHARL